MMRLRSPMALAAALSLATLLATASAAAPVVPASATPTRAPLSTRLDRILNAFARAHPAFPGVALAVRAPGLAWSGAAGVADRVTHQPLIPTAPFRIASVTKTFVAASMLRLVEDGKLGLDDPIAQHLGSSTVAQLRRGGYDVDAIRVRNLLQHTSGLYDYAGSQAYQEFVVSHPHHRWSRAEQLRFALTHGTPLFPPGTDFRYSDTDYILLGEILERRTGHGLAAAYRTLLGFGRLGLRQTYLETLQPRPAGAKPRAHQYLGTTDTTAFDPSFDLYGGGGLVSTVDDLARFYRALLTGHVYKKAATLRTMLGKPNSRRPSDLAMGIFAESVGQETCWHHDGFWGTTVLDCPRAGVTIAITVNQAEGFDTAVQELERTVLRIVRSA
jgi:D-alanyl-D-alanine carboxypeptidase